MARSLVAGSALASDVIKCQPIPLYADNHVRPFIAAQRQALAVVFPQGVCDKQARCGTCAGKGRGQR